VAGKFGIDIYGLEKKGGDYEKFKGIMRSVIGKFAYGHQWKKYYKIPRRRIVIYGTPGRMDYLDNVVKSLRDNLNKYFRNWSFKIVVNYVEERK